MFSAKLFILKKHDFIVKQKSTFFAEKNTMLYSNEAVIMCDFAENYFFVLQDEV